MKKNITINLCGRLYQIDEDAYDLLSHYTDTIRNYFIKHEAEDGEEIANDIESRIAELFEELKAQGVQAITISDVQNIIQQIGNVEDITGSDSSEGETATDSTTAKQKPADTASKASKKLYRNPNDKVVAGVLSGIAQYFGHRASTWRWGYAIILLIWMLIGGINPFTITGGMMSSFSLFFWVPTLLVVIPILFIPVLPYVIGAIFIPEANTPEQSLQMKGKEVNPQNLADEVTELNTQKNNKKNANGRFWSTLTGVILSALSIIVGINFIVFFCIAIGLVAAPQLVAHGMWGADPETVQAFIAPATISSLILVTHIGIILYCCIHGAYSSFSGKGAMSTSQRITWFVGWLITLLLFVGSTCYAMSKYNDALQNIRDREQAQYEKERQEHTHYGFYFNDTDWQFFNDNDYTLSKAQDCSEERYTYIGEYMTGDENVRYLDACNPHGELIYTVFRTDSLQPGIYRLSAAVKAENEGGHIYTQVGGNDSTMLTPIPAFGIEGGNIWEHLTRRNVNTDSVVVDIINRLSPRNKERIKNAHDGIGYGWSYVYIDSIKVSQPTDIIYGVTTDPALTGQEAPQGWVSATDFKIEKIQ